MPRRTRYRESPGHQPEHPFPRRGCGGTGRPARDRRVMDTGSVNGEHFAVMAGAGFDSRMIAGGHQRMKDRLAQGAYLYTGARSLYAHRVGATVEVDGRRFFEEGSLACSPEMSAGSSAASMFSRRRSPATDFWSSEWSRPGIRSTGCGPSAVRCGRSHGRPHRTGCTGQQRRQDRSWCAHRVQRAAGLGRPLGRRHPELSCWPPSARAGAPQTASTRSATARTSGTGRPPSPSAACWWSWRPGSRSAIRSAPAPSRTVRAHRAAAVAAAPGDLAPVHRSHRHRQREPVPAAARDRRC
jgi:hypothetical protein